MLTVAPLSVRAPSAVIEIVEPLKVIPDELIVTELLPTFNLIDVAAVLFNDPSDELIVTELLPTFNSTDVAAVIVEVPALTVME